MLEVAVVVGVGGEVLHWHLPPGRSAVSIPDSRGLWDVLWTHREVVAGVAHTHPRGLAVASQEDLTTFAACEAGLGRRLDWWVATPDAVACFVWVGPEGTDYQGQPVADETLPWLSELRKLSYGGGRDE